jgi:ABC-type bacteriocin/lantibiotic exporter with double-glycine peptidase domain
MRKISLKHRYFPAMKRVRQKSDAHCGPAVLQMLSQFWKLNYTQTEFVKAAHVVNINKTGLTPKDMALAVKRVTPLQFWVKQKTTINQLAKIINNYKVPVGVEWQGVFGKAYSGFDDGHYSIVVKVDKRKRQVIIADPYRHFAGKDRVFTFTEFAKRWWDFNEIKTKTRKKRVIRDRQLIFVLTPKNRHFPEIMKMKQFKLSAA